MIEALPLLAWPVHQQVLTIFAYHRVLPVPDPLRPGEVAAEAFEEQMRFLSRNFSVLSLREAASRLPQGMLPSRACCITFDDGYADNLTVAQPILEKYQLPATVFVATGYLDGQRMFNDAVIDIVAACPQAWLDLEELDLGRHRLENIDDRRAAITAILKRFRYRAPETREVDLARMLDIAACGALPAGAMLSRTQVRELAERGVEIGGHTVTHPILAAVADERAQAEIVAGKQELEAIIGKPVKVFAYPNGKPQSDYAARHVAMARAAGFELAVTTANGVAIPPTDIFQLPRFMPWGASLTKLAARMVHNAWMGKTVPTC